MTIKNPGRPVDGDEREPLTVVNFRIDAETKAALDKIVDEYKPSPGTVLKYKRSHAIRAAILQVAQTGWLPKNW